MQFLVVCTTTPTRREAVKLANLLLQARLAACVQISGPVLSLYRWKKKVQKAREFQLWIKTRKSAWPKVERLLKANHSYEVPEIFSLPFVSGSRDYLSWIQGEVLS